MQRSSLYRAHCDQLNSEVAELIGERSGGSRRRRPPAQPLEGPLPSDSEELFVLVLAVEEAFDIEIADDVVKQLRRGRDLAELVRSALLPSQDKVA